MNSFAFPKNSSLIPFFKHHYHQMQETGLLKRLDAHWAPFLTQKSCNKVEFEGISMKKLIILFVTLLSGTILSAITLFSEIIAVKLVNTIGQSTLTTLL